MTTTPEMAESMTGAWQRYAAAQLRRRSDPHCEEQESFLKRLLSECAGRLASEAARPLRVLDCGCGFGRRLRSLAQTEGLEPYGCDANRESLSVARTLLLGRWPELEERVVHIAPGEPLPWEDGYFDLALSVGALRRTPPELLGALVQELARVTNDTILCLEPPSAPQPMLWDERGGRLWLHDLLGVFEQAGVTDVEVDGDALGVHTLVYRARPRSEGHPRMLSGAECCRGERAVRHALAQAALRYAQFWRDLERQRAENLRARLAELQGAERNARRQVDELRQQLRLFHALKDKPLLRAADWLRLHPRLDAVLCGPMAAMLGLRRWLLRRLGRTADAEAGAPADTSHPDARAPEHAERSNGGY